jgi:hypothetical protein
MRMIVPLMQAALDVGRNKAANVGTQYFARQEIEYIT